MDHAFENIQSLADLENRLRNWIQFASDHEPPYDYNGMFHLLAACLDNIRKNALEAEIEVIGWSLEPEQIDTLIKLAEAAKNPPPEDD